jgi:3D (Asp-Asp-Asp) domain-containing protein
MRVSIALVVLLGVVLIHGSVAAGHERHRHSRQVSPSHRAALRHGRTPLKRLPVAVTAYTPSRRETQGHPRDTASGARVQRGMVALSKDLERELGLAFGDRVTLQGIGTFVFEDRVASRKRRLADIFMESRQAARTFGKRKAYILAQHKPYQQANRRCTRPCSNVPG